MNLRRTCQPKSQRLKFFQELSFKLLAVDLWENVEPERHVLSSVVGDKCTTSWQSDLARARRVFTRLRRLTMAIKGKTSRLQEVPLSDATQSAFNHWKPDLITQHSGDQMDKHNSMVIPLTKKSETNYLIFSPPSILCNCINACVTLEIPQNV